MVKNGSKPYEQMDDLGGKTTPIFGVSTHVKLVKFSKFFWRHVQKVITIQRYARGFLVRLRMWRQALGHKSCNITTRIARMMFIEIVGGKNCYLEGLGGLKPW